MFVDFQKSLNFANIFLIWYFHFVVKVESTILNMYFKPPGTQTTKQLINEKNLLFPHGGFCRRPALHRIGRRILL